MVKDEMWKTLKHRGPMLAPPYKRVPRDYKFKYGTRNLTLSLRAEEYAMHYARYLLRKPSPRIKIKQNFFADWKSVMSREEGRVIQKLSKCDFTCFMEYIEDQAEEKSNMTRRQKDNAKAKKEQLEARYKVVTVDGRKELLSNYMVEPPGLYFGRGDNKNIGRVKRRIQMKDITINCSNPGRFPNRNSYKEVRSDPTVTWIASWTDSITGKPKYIHLHASSKIKTDSDRNKFNKAGELAKNIESIKQRYQRGLTSKDLAIRQLATATYLIHHFALRVGNEKTNKNEAETVGCLSLKKKHILGINRRRSEVEFKFVGKDSVRYEKVLKVAPKVAKNLEDFRKARGKEKIFYEINPQTLNEYLDEMRAGLTAKVFRTYMATECFKKEMSRLVKTIPSRGGDQRLRIWAIKMANMEVAKFLNHKTMTNPKARQKVVKRMEELIQTLHQRMRNAGCKNDIDKWKRDISFKKHELDLKKELVNFAPQTSKANYIDPRVIVQWCRKLKVPVETIFTKAELKKFAWAIVGGQQQRQQKRRNIKVNKKHAPPQRHHCPRHRRLEME